ncbi:MAG: C40 family peptidase [Oscillospiraceae bacterium]|nr:C40 family peptidase [Oscillospiraceae bacterium]
MRKNLLRTLLCMLLIGSMLSVPAYAESAVLTGSDINVREGPGTNYRVIDCLPYGARVNVTDRSNGTWYAVEYGGVKGFMSAAFLQLEEEEQWDVQYVHLGGDIYGGVVDYVDEPVSHPIDNTPVNTDTNQQPAEQPQPAATPKPVTTKPQATEQPAATPAPSAAATGQSGTVNAMYVRFRSGPGSTYSVLGEYNKGKSLVVVGSSGAWLACVIDGRSGYMYADYVTLGEMVTVSDETASGGGGTTVITSYDPYLDEPVEIVVPATAAPKPVASATPAPSASPAATANAAAVQAEGIINGDYVRFRTGPGTNYQIIDSYNRGMALQVVGTSGDWTACLINGVFGYVHSAYVLVTSTNSGANTGAGGIPQPVATVTPTATPTPVVKVENKEGYVSGNNVRMRSGASMTASILDELYYGNKVTITGTSGDWTAVIYNGQAGFIYSQFVKEGSFNAGNAVGTGSAGSDSTTLSGSSYQKGQQIANFALQYVGYNYSWGGMSPDTGFDCSGLVYYTYKHFGYTLNRVAQDQARNGVAVSADQLQPGDILCFYSGSSYIGHSGIYIGDGKFVHAQNSATGVVITELAGHYADRGFEARRIV